MSPHPSKTQKAELKALEELKIQYPDFKSMSRDDIFYFLYHYSGLTKYLDKDGIRLIIPERTDAELEIMCKQTYLKIQESLREFINSKPSSIICIIPSVE